MGFNNSFDDNENDYDNTFASQDSQDESRRDTYGALSDGYLDHTGKKSCSCRADVEFFEKVFEIRTKVAVANSIFKAAADGFHNNEFSAPKLEFTALPTIPVTISTTPDIKIYNDILGCYVGKDCNIEMDMDKIESEASSLSVKSTDLAVIVFLHELMHHVMRAENEPTGSDHLYWSFREEAMANALMLKVLDICGEDALKDKAVKFIYTQPDDLGYTYAQFIPDHEQDVDGWIKEKNAHDTDVADMDAYLDTARSILRASGRRLEFDKYQK